MNEEKHYGWICPKCGCPNAPTNKTCVACFAPKADDKNILTHNEMIDHLDPRKFLTEGENK